MHKPISKSLYIYAYSTYHVYFVCVMLISHHLNIWCILCIFSMRPCILHVYCTYSMILYILCVYIVSIPQSQCRINHLVEGFIKHKMFGGFFFFLNNSCDLRWIFTGYQKNKRRCLKNKTLVKMRITFFEMPTFMMEKNSTIRYLPIMLQKSA